MGGGTMATSLAPAGENVRANGSNTKLQRGGSRRVRKVEGTKGPEEEFLRSFARNTISDDTLLVGILSGVLRIPRNLPDESRPEYLAAIRRHLETKYGLADRHGHGIGRLTATYRNGVTGPAGVNIDLTGLLRAQAVAVS